MKLQLVGSGQTVKERDFFAKTEFDSFERIVRHNFDPRNEANPQVRWRRTDVKRRNFRTVSFSSATPYRRTAPNRIVTISELSS